MPATHQGTCQCCGRTQKLPNGVLSKHGYTVDWGMFHGVCQGAGKKPYEESCELIQDFIAQAEAQLEQVKAEIEQLTHSTDANEVWHQEHRSRRECRHGQKPGYYWEKLAITEVELSYLDGEKHSTFEWVFPEPRRFSEKRAGNFETKTLGEVVRHENGRYVRSVLQKHVTDIEKYIAWQKERVANWKPQPLTPLKAA